VRKRRSESGRQIGRRADTAFHPDQARVVPSHQCATSSSDVLYPAAKHKQSKQKRKPTAGKVERIDLQNRQEIKLCQIWT